MRNLSLLIIVLLLNLVCNSQILKQVDWVADIDFLATELPQKHYDFFTVKDKKEFLVGLDKIKSSSAKLTDIEVAIKLQQLIAGFGDSHTSVNYAQLIDKNKILPLHLYWFSDGLYILHTTQENIEILGHQIVSVNGVPLKTITDSLGTMTTKDNQAIIKNSIPKLLPLAQVLECFGFIKEQEIKLELKDLNGIKKTYVLKLAEMTRQNRKTCKPDSLALCYRNERAFFVDYYQAKDNVYYLQYNKCWSKELELQNGNTQNAEKMPSFKEFEERVFQTLANNRVDKLVFDMRFNGGGNSIQGTQFVEKLAKFLENNSKIKLYVVVGRNTFSSAILNAMDFKRLTNAVFVGEETSGKPNHFGEVKNFKLPSSGIRVDYSTKYFKRTDEKVTTISPDIKLEPSFSDFARGIDPVYEWIKNQ
ncbi:S41 family peptidase [Flavobacterium limnophilum]|uniref:S41 family peptidase n=1 Tax=Flavobacterium limnophilum TaxID=3003262 RepID=UPI0022AC42AF|nr:S41 family peptidase [Flavobacterium limnophilum]